jgi:hypothetical protein
MADSGTCSEASARRAASRTFARAALPIAIYAALAVCATWPLAARIGSALPRGHLSNGALQFFNLWTLEWNADRIRHGFAGYWRAPIFYPETHAFAFSEPMPLTGAAFALLAPVTGPVAGYNLVLLSFLVLNGIATRRLMIAGGVDGRTALAGGALGVIVPFALKELGVLQLTALFPVIFAFAELCWLFRAPSAAGFVRLALWFAATLGTCVYYALFLSVFLALFACALLNRALLRRDLLLGAAAALAIAGAAAAPIALGQRPALARFERSAASIRRGSALASSYLSLPPRTLAARATHLPSRGRTLYPGVVLCALALLGLDAAARSPQKRWLWCCAAGAGLAALFSLGTRLEIAGVQPYALTLQRFVPGFAQLRSPYRFGAFAQVLLLPLAGLGLARLARLPLARRTRGATCAALIAVVALAYADVVPLGQKLAPFPAAALREPWVAWLAAHPEGVVAMLPPEVNGKLHAFEPITLAMLQGLAHGHPLLNGYSGFFPKRTSRLNKAMRAFPAPDGIAALRGAGVRFAAADTTWLDDQDALATLQRMGDAAPRIVHRDPRRAIFDLGAR